MNRSLQARLISWGISGTFGVIAAAVLFLVYLYPQYYSPEAKRARRLGVDPGTYVEVTHLSEQMIRSRNASEKELTVVKHLLDNPSSEVRGRAMDCLLELHGSPREGAAADIARNQLADENWYVRTTAMFVLYRLHAPDALSVAKKVAATDNNSEARQSAKKILSGKAKRR